MTNEHTKFSFTAAHIGMPSELVPDYCGEAFTGVDGHFVGGDGFVCPADFSEFLERYPTYVRNWVSKKLRKPWTNPDVEDWTNTLLMHLYNLPEGKYTRLGFTDVISVFNPWAHYGAGASRFFNFLNRCLNNKLLSRITKANRDALSDVHFAFSIDEALGGQDGDQHQGREYILVGRSQRYACECEAQGIPMDKIFVQQFKDWIQNREPSLVPLIDALMTKDKVDEILVELDINHSQFIKNRKRLVQLGRIFAGAFNGR